MPKYAQTTGYISSHSIMTSRELFRPELRLHVHQRTVRIGSDQRLISNLALGRVLRYCFLFGSEIARTCPQCFLLIYLYCDLSATYRAGLSLSYMSCSSQALSCFIDWRNNTHDRCFISRALAQYISEPNARAP